MGLASDYSLEKAKSDSYRYLTLSRLCWSYLVRLVLWSFHNDSKLYIVFTIKISF